MFSTRASIYSIVFFQILVINLSNNIKMCQQHMDSLRKKSVPYFARITQFSRVIF